MTRHITWEYLALYRGEFKEADSGQRGWLLDLWSETRDRLIAMESWWREQGSDALRDEYARIADLWSRMVAWGEAQGAAQLRMFSAPPDDVADASKKEVGRE